MAREEFKSRMGFLLISAGCAIGLGNVWRFPYITGQYGGAIFVLIYIAFLLLFGLPILTMEIAVGRASRRSLGRSFEVLKPGSKWAYNKYWMISGNYILMAFYSLVTGWMFYYAIMMITGQFGQNIDQATAGGYFNDLLSKPLEQFICTVVLIIGSFAVCAFGLRRGVERINKPMMLLLFCLLIFLALRSFTLPGFKEGMSYYLMPNFENMQREGVLNAISAAMGQAFFTLSLGVGSIQIFGSYMKKDRTIGSEAVFITILDTCVALLAGVVIFPACFSYAVEPGQGPGLIFVTLVSVFSHMEYGAVWGGIFFIFMLFAAITTLIAVFENIIAISMEIFNISRIRAVVINCVVIILLGLPCMLGYNLLSDVHPMGGERTILDTYDFVLSNNILPFGAMCYILFVVLKRGWGFDNYLKEVNTGIGVKMPRAIVWYYRLVLPIVIFLLFIQGYIGIFG
ncbi:MAG: sodium-dependent transporter [Candidatus Anaerobiospirillum merdipullorum]|uniref:Transporter n=1 Tax=Candidatus Anaerobiospirillum merdipullorum TaxID=2838450 RepID=A0A9E2KQU3_9GAMM|nr:sodium-dependent transporter [Candidatus Anaerobiospirillum merdipullorum]